MKSFLIFCALCCFIAVFKLPITYYAFLRVLISMMAVLVIYDFLKHKHYPWVIIFAIILILFNPIFPIYLYRKAVWIPIDIIVGVLLLLIAFLKSKEYIGKEKTMKPLVKAKTYSRDRIISSKIN